MALFAALHITTQTSTAEVGWGEVVGTSKSIMNAVNQFMGSTEVTPSCTLLSWRNDAFGVYRDYPYAYRGRVNRDMPTGTLFYERQYLQTDGSYFVDDSPFPIVTLRRKNYRCDMSQTDADGNVVQFIYNELEDFDVAVWASRVVKTGYFPPAQPYKANLRVSAITLSPNCNPISPTVLTGTIPVSIFDTGYSVVKFPWVNAEYNWPPLCWVGSWLDY